MRDQLTRLELPFEVIEATDGHTLSPTDLGRLHDLETSRSLIGYTLRASEVGCAHSHARVYRRMVDENIPHALILEDDVELDMRLGTIIQDPTAAMSTCDWLQLNYPPVGSAFLRAWIGASVHQARVRPSSVLYSLIKFPFILLVSIYEGVRERLFSNKPRAARFIRPLYLAGAYIVSIEGAKKVLPLCEPILFAADMLPNKARVFAHLRMRGVVPLLARQRTDRFVSDNI